jgi:cytidylate kinase
LPVSRPKERVVAVDSAEPDRPGRRLVVAIDGPSGSGKSTVARRVAAELGLRYLDTGAMYRAVTWLALRRGTPLDDERQLVGLAGDVEMQVGTDPAQPWVHLDGLDVTPELRTSAVSAAVSVVSAVPGVRRELVRRQRELIGTGGIVVEGRDIGTVVAPDADVKVFLTAAVDERVARRGRQLAEPDAAARRDVQGRDLIDSTRRDSPLVRAADAVEIDSTRLGADEVVAAVLRLVPSARAGESGRR